MGQRPDPYRFGAGSTRIEPETDIAAGIFFTRMILFASGKYGADEVVRIPICMRLSCGMELPRFTGPSGYVTAKCPNPEVRLALSCEEQG